MTANATLPRRSPPWLILALPALAAGCYKYVPVVPAETPVAKNVRAYLSDGARRRLEGVIPLGHTYLDGLLLQQAGDTLLVEVAIRRGEGISGDPAFLQRIQLTRDEIASLQLRELDQFKVWLAGGVATAGAVALVAKMLSGRAGGGAFPPDGGTGLEELGGSPFGRP